MALNDLHKNIPPKVVTAVLVVFVIGWAVSLVAEIFKPDYNSPTGLNEAMITIVTAFFVAQQGLSKKDDKDDDDDTPAQQQQQPQSEEADHADDSEAPS